MVKTDLLGPWGEEQAVKLLRKKHYTIVACNYHSRFGEIDIIAQNRKYLAFVEVKLRKNSAYGEAREFVDRRKQTRIRQTAMIWLETHETDLQPRFDVIEIYAPDGMDTKNPQLMHLENAFG